MDSQDFDALYLKWKNADREVFVANDRWLHHEIDDVGYEAFLRCAELAKRRYFDACDKAGVVPEK